MVGCSVFGCKSRSERKLDGITFHLFPLKEEIRKKWIEATGRLNWQPTKHSKICSIHFNDDSFIYTEKRALLKPNSFPEKHLNLPSAKKRSNNILQEVQIVQPSMLYLALTGSSYMSGSEIYGRQDTFRSFSNTEVFLKTQLLNDRDITYNRLKKLRAMREFIRIMSKKTARLEKILTELKCKLSLYDI